MPRKNHCKVGAAVKRLVRGKDYLDLTAANREAHGVYERSITGKVNRQLVDYRAVCDNANCKYLKKDRLRACEMPKDQFAVMFFLFFSNKQKITHTSHISQNKNHATKK